MTTARLPTTKAIVGQLGSRLQGKLTANTDWTFEVFQAADNILRGTRRTTHAARRREGSGWCPEYLVDLAISDDSSTGDDPYGYRGLLLALECEWGPSLPALKYDFCKLVDTKARRRVFVGYTSDGNVTPFLDTTSRFLWRHAHGSDDDEYGVILFTGEAPTSQGWVLTRAGSTGGRFARHPA